MDRKIIIVNDFDYVQGGASRVAIDTARILYKNGHDVTLFSAVSNGIEKYEFKSISLNQKEVARSASMRNLYNFKAKRELSKLIKESNNPIVHIHGWTKALSSSIFSACFKNKCDVFLTLHDYFSICPNGGFFNYKKNTVCKKKALSLKCICTNCDSRNYLVKMFRIARIFIQNRIVKMPKKIPNIITISDFSESILRKFFLKAKVFRVYNPVDNDYNDRTVCENNKNYVYVGRLDITKGVDVVCKAFLDFHEKLIVVGDGPISAALKKDFSHADNIEFVGWKRADEVYQILSTARCFIFPTRLYEVAPLGIIEAISMGVPCIISDNSAAINFVDVNNGFVFSLADLNGFVDILRISTNNELIQTKSILSYDTYDKYGFNETSYYKNLISTFQCKDSE